MIDGTGSWVVGQLDSNIFWTQPQGLFNKLIAGNPFFVGLEKQSNPGGRAKLNGWTRFASTLCSDSCHKIRPDSIRSGCVPIVDD